MKLIIFNLFSMNKTFDAVLKDCIFLQFCCFLFVFYVRVQRIGSGSSTCSKKLVILAAITLEHSSQIFSHARASFGHIF